MKRVLIILSAVLLLGVTGCRKVISIEQLEKELVGAWWNGYQYSDVTEDGVPFSNVLLAVIVDADHTGCIYLGVFDDVHRDPLAVYGGPKDAGFKWRLLEDGSVELSDPASGESTVLTYAGTKSGSSYGNDMTNVSNTNMTYTGGNVTVTNGTYSGTLTKEEAGTKEWNDARTACSGKTAVPGGTWRLPSEADWQYMLIGCGSGHTYTNNPPEGLGFYDAPFTAKVKDVTGNLMATNYWTSTEVQGSYAFFVIVGGFYASFYVRTKSDDRPVRAVLAF